MQVTDASFYRPLSAFKTSLAYLKSLTSFAVFFSSCERRTFCTKVVNNFGLVLVLGSISTAIYRLLTAYRPIVADRLMHY